MAADEILGISAQLDANDMFQAFEDLEKKLQKLGYDTTDLQSKLQVAWNEIAKSTDTGSEKAQQAFKTISDAISEYQKKLETTPQAIKSVSGEIDNVTQSIESIKQRISKAQTGTDEWKDLNKVLDGHYKTLGRLNETYESLTATFSETQQVVTTLTSAFDIANAGRSISNVATGVSATAHAAAALAVGTEATAHASNALNIGDETQKVQANADAIKQATDASNQHVTAANEEAAALDRVTQRLQEGKVTEDEYLRAKESANERLQQLSEEASKLTEKQQEALHLAQDAFSKGITGEMSPEQSNKAFETYGNIVENLGRQITGLNSQYNNLQQSLNALKDAYSSLHQAQAEQSERNINSQKQEKDGTDKATEAIKAKEAEIKSISQQIEVMQAHHEKGWGADFISNIQEGKNPFSAISSFFGERQEIKEKQQQLTDLESELAKLKQSSEEVKNSTSDMFAGMTKEDIATTIKENIEQLKILKGEEQDYKRAKEDNSEKAKENKKQQAEITDEIIKGKERLKEMGTSYEDVTKKAKETAKETNKVGKEAEGAAKKVNGIFSKIKDAFADAMKGNLTGMMSLVTKFGPWAAAVTASVVGIKKISEANQQLEESLLSLKGYIDGNTLEDLRTQFVELEYSSTQAAEEMAKSATRWVKYFEGLRGSASAIAEVTKSSNNLATILGTTSEKAADYQLKIAGAYHQTALDAKENSTIIINASKKSTANYEGMAQALASTSNRAQNAGVSLKELAAATAYGSSTFGSASEAANNYVMMMTRLSTQSKNEFNPTVVGATKALENLAKSDNINNTLTELLGKRQASLSKVFVQNADAIAKMQSGLYDETKAAKTLEAVEGKVENQEKKLQNAKRALAHEVNVNLTPAYIKFIEILGYAIKSIGQISNKVQNAVQPVINTIGKGIDWLSEKIGRSNILKIWKPIAYISNPLAALTIENMAKDKATDAHNKNLQAAYNKNLQKYGSARPGMAFLSTIKEFTSKSGKVSKSDAAYLRQLMQNTRTETAAKVSGKALTIGKQNAIDDKGTANKQKQLEDQQRKFREQEAEQEAKKLANAEKVKWDLYIAEKEAGIARLKTTSEKEEAQHKLDIEKQRHAIKVERKSLLQANIAEAKQSYEKNPNNKKKEGFYVAGLDKQVKLTFDQEALLKAKSDLLDAQEEDYERKRMVKRLQSLHDYLKEYGTIQEQRYAIAKEYDAKIAEASDENEKRRLQKEKKSALSQADAKNIAMGIDWGSSFEGIGNVLKDIAKETLSKVTEYMETSDFKSLSANDKKAYADLRNNLLKETSGGADTPFNLKIWDEVKEDVTAYQESVRKLQKATEAHDKAIWQYEKAEDEFANATTDKARNIAKIKLNVTKENVQKTGESQQTAEGEVQKAQSDLTTSTTLAAQGLQNFQSMLSNITSGSLKGFASGVGQLINSIAGGSTKVGDALQGLGGKVGGLVGAILTLMDALGNNPSDFINQLFDKINWCDRWNINATCVWRTYKDFV